MFNKLRTKYDSSVSGSFVMTQHCDLTLCYRSVDEGEFMKERLSDIGNTTCPDKRKNFEQTHRNVLFGA